VDRWVNGWMDECIDAWLNRWMGRWMKGSVFSFSSLIKGVLWKLKICERVFCHRHHLLHDP